jgi:hypothetical protein
MGAVLLGALGVLGVLVFQMESFGGGIRVTSRGWLGAPLAPGAGLA